MTASGCAPAGAHLTSSSPANAAGAPAWSQPAQCCYWDDGTEQTGYCDALQAGGSNCYKCKPTKGECDLLAGCAWVDETPQVRGGPDP